MKEAIMYDQDAVDRQLYWAGKYTADISVFDQLLANQFTGEIAATSYISDLDARWVAIDRLLDHMRAVLSRPPKPADNACATLVAKTGSTCKVIAHDP
jgi:hypothetical protein